MLFVLAVLARIGASKEAREGEEDFEALYRGHYSRVVNFFRARNRSREECEDLAQETFLRAYRSFDGFREESKFSTWILTIAGNLWINHLRDAGALKRSAEETPIHEDAPVADFRPGAESKLADRERRALLRSTIEELPPKMRLCVLHRVHGERSFAEIAALTNMSESTAKSHWSRAVPRLRDRLAEHYPEFFGAQLLDTLEPNDE